MDPIQKQVLSLMPWVLMFVMAPFAAGLVIYWITNNILTMAQQKMLYARHPVLKQQAADAVIEHEPSPPAPVAGTVKKGKPRPKPR